jgi:hypothetical protein
MEAFSTGRLPPTAVGSSATAEHAESPTTAHGILALLGTLPGFVRSSGRPSLTKRNPSKLQAGVATADESIALRRASIGDMADAIADVWLTGDVAADDDAEVALAHSPVLGAPRPIARLGNAQLLQPRQHHRGNSTQQKPAPDIPQEGAANPRYSSAFFPDPSTASAGLEDFAFAYSDDDSVAVDHVALQGPAAVEGAAESEQVGIPTVQIEPHDSFAAILGKAAALARDAASNPAVVAALAAQTGFSVETIVEAANELQTDTPHASCHTEISEVFPETAHDPLVTAIAAPAAHSSLEVTSSLGYQVVVRPDGRRVKVLAMEGNELWDLFRTQLRALAIVHCFCSRAVTSRRVTKWALVGHLLGVAAQRHRAIRTVKLSVVGLFRRALTDKTLLARAPKLLFLGLCRLAMRMKVVPGRQNEAKPVAPKATKLPDPEDPGAPKTRAIHWDAITDTNVSGTIWDREQRGSASSLDLTNLMPNLVEKFAVQAGHSSKPSEGTKAAVPSAKANQPITLLASQKAQNVAIALSNIVGRRSLQDIRDALYAVDDELLGGGIDRVQILLGLDIYSPDTTNPIKDYTGTCISKSEQFFSTERR